MPVWSGGPDGAVVDLRARQDRPVPSVGEMTEVKYDAGRARTLPDGTSVGVRMFHHDGVALHVQRQGRSVLVVRDTGGTVGSVTHGAMVGLMPGLAGVLPASFAGTEWWGEDEDPVPGFSTRRRDTGMAGLDALFAVAADPAGWVNGQVGLFDPATASGAIAVLGWATAGLSCAQAARLEGLGVAPAPYLEWSWSGWDDEEIADWLPGSEWEATEAAAYRDAGMERPQAGVWFRNAKWLHPATAAVVASHGWSATAAGRVRRAVERDRPGVPFASWWDPDDLAYPQAGDVLLQDWAALGLLRPAQVIECVVAGLSAAEVGAWLAEGALDVDRIRLMAALRARPRLK